MFGYKYYIVYIHTYYIEPLEEFLYIFFEDIGAITNPHTYFFGTRNLPTGVQ